MYFFHKKYVRVEVNVFIIIKYNGILFKFSLLISRTVNTDRYNSNKTNTWTKTLCADGNLNNF